MEENKPENNKIKKKEKKNLRRILKPTVIIGCVGLALTLTGLSPEKSIKVPKDSTVSEISVKYGIPQQRIVRVNDLENPDYIQAGQDLVLRRGGTIGYFQNIFDRL
jgi:LysM repeat protein